MGHYWDGPSLHDSRPRRIIHKQKFIAQRAPNQYRHAERSLLPRRWRARWRLITLKFGDIVFLTRYQAHLTLLAAAFIIAIIHGIEFSTLLSQAPTYTYNNNSVRPAVWGSNEGDNSETLNWRTLPFTVISERPALARLQPITYQVREGDNPEVIAKRFGLQPTTIIWANSAVEENPYLLSLGQILTIPPVDGVLHTVRKGDTITTMAAKYEVDRRLIMEYEANNLKNKESMLVVGELILVPGGVKREKPPEPIALEPLPPTPVPPTATPIPPTAVPTAPPTAVPTQAPVFVPTAALAATRIAAATYTFVPTNVPAPTYTFVPTRVPAPTNTFVPTRVPAPTNTPVQTNNDSYAGSSGCCRWPLTGRITTQPASWHMALDILAWSGTPIVAADGGRVVAAGWDNTGYGYRLIINHGNGISTLYAHLSSFTVSYGDYVNKGAVIGRVGSTGRSTAPHLHFEVRRNNIRQNPYNWLP